MRTKLALLGLLALLGSSGAAAGPERRPPPGGYPPLPAAGASAQAFAPRGWTVETQAEGDLDGDGTADLAFILLAPDSAGAPSRYANPRIIGIGLGRPGGGYRLVASDRRFLPPKRAPNGGSEGWMLFGKGSLDAGGGRLRIVFEYTRGHRTFTFGWRQGGLRLVGFDTAAVDGGCVRELSANFLSSRARIGAAAIEADKPSVRWQRLPPRAGPSLEQIGPGEEFDPGGLLARFPLTCRGAG